MKLVNENSILDEHKNVKKVIIVVESLWNKAIFAFVLVVRYWEKYDLQTSRQKWFQVFAS